MSLRLGFLRPTSLRQVRRRGAGENVALVRLVDDVGLPQGARELSDCTDELTVVVRVLGRFPV